MDVTRLFGAIAIVVFITAPVVAGPARAQSSYFESEPNDTPANANAISGAISLVGDLGGRDQDAYMWTVSDVDAQKRWTFELEGLPGTPTIAEVNRIDFAENGVDVVARKKLFVIGSGDGLKPGLMEDLMFQPGEYLIGVASAGGMQGNYRLHIRPGKKLVVSTRPPNNPEQASAYKLNPGTAYAAFVETAESWFKFDIKVTQSDHPWVTKVQVPVGQTAQLLVQDSSGETLSSTAANTLGLLTSDDLDLAPGSYFLQISNDAEAMISDVIVQALGTRVVNGEATTASEEGAGKPKKSTWALAKRIDLSQQVNDLFGTDREYHYFSFDLDEAMSANVLSLQLNTNEARSVNFCLLDHKGTRVQCRSNTGSVELPDLVLSPGTWGIVADSRYAEPSPFSITLNAVAPVQANIEAEPNDNMRQATGMPVDGSVTGRFASREEDFFRIVVTGEAQLWNINAEGEEIYELRYHDGAGVQSQKVNPGKGQREAQLQNVFMMPGQHFLSIKGDNNGAYTLSLQALGPPDPDGEREPNGDKSRAEVLHPSQNRHGLLANKDDWDFYRFTVSNDGYYRISIVPPAGGKIRTYLDFGTTQLTSLLTAEAQTSIIQGIFAPGEYQVRLLASPPGTSTYSIKLEQLPRFSCSVDCEPVHTRKIEFLDEATLVTTPGGLQLNISLELENLVVAAYQPYGQRVPARLKVINNTGEAKSLGLEAVASDYRWRVELPKGPIELDAGQSVELPVQIMVPRDAWAEHPILISTRLFDDSGAQTATSVVIDVDGYAPGINPYPSWDLPVTMLGGQNAAWTALGGERIVMPDETEQGKVPGVGRYFDEYFDGGVRQSTGGIIDSGRKIEPVSLSVKLAGDSPLDVTGIILNPLGRGNAVSYLADFELQLSSDGEQYQTVLSDRLQPLAVDQVFPLDEPVTARFARLQLINSQDGKSNGQIGLGEWKVVAKPGMDLSGGKGFNIASPELGGHVVWSRPATWANWETGLLTEKNDHHTFRLKPGVTQEWAVGFQHERAARISRLEWVDSDRVKPGQMVTKINLSVATGSPVGPWISIGDWDRSSSPNEYVFEKPVWARYVRFQISSPEKQDRLYAPATLRIFEQESDESYSSILGEWGERSPRAVYEKTLESDIVVEVRPASGNNNRDHAVMLAFDQLINGRVILGEEEDWYKLTVPAGSNTIYITQSGTPVLRTLLHMEDQAGKAVKLTQASGSSNSEKLKAVVEPGANYWVRVEEPPRSVIFAFDNSGSVSPFSTSIYRAIYAYAGDLVPGRDEAKIIAFGDEFLTRDWVGEPYIQRMAINDYARDAVSSAAEETLLITTKALASKPGTKAVVIVTDAATPRKTVLWNALEKVQPRVFTMRVGVSDKTGQYEDLMQSWSMVNEGYYSYMTTQAEMDRAFDRAATMLRQPAGYDLVATAVFEKAPGPGKLKLVSGENKGIGAAVALILDASGSMLKRMDGTRRIVIAKELLSKAVTEHIPAGTPVALRVFGHKEANSCRTDLVIPMQPLDPEAVQKTLADINAKNLAKTPIADSLAMIESDLKDATGPRLVVLVTDGEETCDGDPTEVLEKLADKGIDIRLEIVGFAIDDDNLKQQFEAWAEQGGGRYFDATDASSLENSLAEALQVPYSVFDLNGTLVASGTVDGEALELKAGTYRVNIATSPPRLIEAVEIPGEKEIIVPVD